MLQKKHISQREGFQITYEETSPHLWAMLSDLLPKSILRKRGKMKR